MASHSGAGTEAKLMIVPYSRLKSVSHTQVLISYTLGYGSQADTADGASTLSTKVALTMMSPHANGPSRSSTTARGSGTCREQIAVANVITPALTRKEEKSSHTFAWEGQLHASIVRLDKRSLGRTNSIHIS